VAYTPGKPIVGVAETPKTRWRTVPYTGGRGLDLGCGAERLFNTEFVLSIDNGHDTDLGQVAQANVQADARDLSMFSAGKWDYVYSSYLLQYFPYEQVHVVLRDWMRVIKVNACVVLYLPDAEQYPRVGTPQAHPRQQWDVTYDAVVEAMVKTTWNWDLCDFQKCSDDDEYSHFYAFRKLK